MAQLAVTAIGRDRPGIVGALTGVLVAHRTNLADAQMGLLGGRFSMMLVVDVPPDADRSMLAEDLQRIAEDLGLDAVTLSDVAPVESNGSPEPTHMVSVYGIDHPGIVHAVTTGLARRGVNITDLNTRRVEEDDGPPLYAMMLEISTPANVRDVDVTSALERVADEQDLDVVVRRLAVDDEAA